MIVILKLEAFVFVKRICYNALEKSSLIPIFLGTPLICTLIRLQQTKITCIVNKLAENNGSFQGHFVNIRQNTVKFRRNDERFKYLLCSLQIVDIIYLIGFY